jgi:transcriptional regulator with XRE-family HTH domain
MPKTDPRALELGQRLRQAAAHRGMKQADIVRALGAPPGTISRYFSGTRRMSDNGRLSEIATLLGVSFEWLSLGRGQPSYEPRWWSPPSESSTQKKQAAKASGPAEAGEQAAKASGPAEAGEQAAEGAGPRKAVKRARAARGGAPGNAVKGAGATRNDAPGNPSAPPVSAAARATRGGKSPSDDIYPERVRALVALRTHLQDDRDSRVRDILLSFVGPPYDDWTRDEWEAEAFRERDRLEALDARWNRRRTPGAGPSKGRR